MKILVTVFEYWRLRDLAHELDVSGWNDAYWYGIVRRVLGTVRCPPPYSGPHDLVVEGFASPDETK